jgi:hypothetical protein
MIRETMIRTLSQRIAFGALALMLVLPAVAAGPAVGVEFDASKAAPRTVEDQTKRRIEADYRLAWTNLAEAVDLNDSAPLQSLFVGSAKKWLTDTVSNQQQSGLTTKYLNQNHKLEAVFYAPEGDVMELHDTAEYQMQVLDGSKVIYDQPVVAHFIVLITPGADRWVIRQLQSVPHF